LPKSKRDIDKDLRAGLARAGKSWRETKTIFFREDSYKGIALRNGKLTFQTSKHFERWARLNFDITNSKIPENDFLRTVFEIADMDHEDPSDWRKLLLFFAEHHFRRAKTKPRKSFLEFWAYNLDYEDVKRKNPNFKEKQACEYLIRHKRSIYGKYTVETLRKVLRQARSKNRNPAAWFPGRQDIAAGLMRAEYEKRGLSWTPEAAIYAAEVWRNFISDTHPVGKIPSHS